MHIAVIGAGPAGLCAIKHAISPEFGMSCTAFEQYESIGGTWCYTDKVGCDEYGIPIHTSMYQNLRINIPKEIVHYPGYPHKEGPESYITSEEILEYLNDYADNFNLRPHIKLNHHVKKIQPIGNGKWEIKVIHLPTNEEKVYVFDAIMICNGLNNVPQYPKMKGMETFLGKSMHSHDYRHPGPFQGHRVLVIGSGPSGMDVAHHVSPVADKVIISHHSEKLKTAEYAENVVMKTDVTEIKSNSVLFADGTEEEIDTIVYCTGYSCSYPFLTEDCGISVEKKYVYPLYKYCINACHPSMCILGNLGWSMQFPTFDIQVRFFLKSLTNHILPSTSEMFEEIEEFAKKKLKEGMPKSMMFITTSQEDADYYRSIADMAKIQNIPKVMSEIHARAIDKLFCNFPKFRNDIYKVIDSTKYEVKDPE